MTYREIAKKFDQIVEFAGIDKFLDTPVKYYSSGMYVRLAFSVAAHMEPDILIIDEVLAVGDAEFQKKCLGKMDEISKTDGRTILFVSHNMGAIEQLCEKTILIDKGEIQMIGDTDKVINIYNHSNEDFEGDSNPVIFEHRKKVNDEFIFNKIWITDHIGKLTNSIPHNEDFIIHLEFDIQKETNLTEISIGLKNTNGVNVTFNSLSDSLDGDNYHFKIGKYLTSTKINKNFLMPDIYTVRICAHERGFRDIDKYDDAIRFKISDAGSSMSPYGEAGLYLSCVFNNARWQIRKI